uniref:UCH domain-containing protein n=1 Tax=Rodentolepis nana TaxID=102285 RepID=A0A0R3TIA2_RODNA
LIQLLDHVNQGENISTRLNEAAITKTTTTGNVYSPVKTTRSKRSRADVGGDTSTSELDATASTASLSTAAVSPSIVTACESLLRQLKLIFVNKLKSLQELASDGRSALLKLLEAFQTYSNTEASIPSTSSKVKEAMEIFGCRGITRFAESPSSLIARLASTGLAECLEKCLCESCDEHCNHLAASKDPKSLDVNTQVAQLIFWWCEQVIRCYGKGTEQLEVTGHWLTHTRGE